MKKCIDIKWILTEWFDESLFSTDLTQIYFKLLLIISQLLNTEFFGQCLVAREQLSVFYLTYKAHIVFRREYQKKRVCGMTP